MSEKSPHKGIPPIAEAVEGIPKTKTDAHKGNPEETRRSLGAPPSYEHMVDDQGEKEKVRSTGVLFPFEGEPEAPYAHPLALAGGIELVERADPTTKTVRPGVRSGGRSRKRKTVPKAAVLTFPAICDTEFQTVPDPDSGWFHGAVLGVCERLGRGSVPISVQLRGVTAGAPVRTYLHPSYRKLFPKAKPEGLIETKEPLAHYLAEALGTTVRFDWKETIEDPDYKSLSNRRILRIVLHAHFALADFLRVWGDNRIVEHLRELTRSTKDRPEPWIHQGRRLRCARTVRDGSPPVRWLPIPVVVVIGKRKFALQIDIYDNSAMLGNAGRSLKGFHSCAGVAMEAKDNFTKENKERMLLTFISTCDRKGLETGAYSNFLPSGYDLENDPSVPKGGSDLFLSYAEGDVLSLYEAIEGVTKQFRRIYKSLGLAPYYRPPRPTTGSTVHDLLRAATYRIFESSFEGMEDLLTKEESKLVGKYREKGFDGLTDSQKEKFPYWFLSESESAGYDRSIPKKLRKLVEEIGFEPAEAKRIAEASNWSGLNAKVFGGRCINSAPTIIGCKDAPIADVDLSGCYVAAMYQQEFPVGRPLILGRSYARSSKRNKYQTLREFLKEYRSELVDSLWQVWISIETPQGKPIKIPFRSDFFPSWEAPVTFYDHEKEEEGLWLERSDQVRHYLEEITNTVLTSDGLEWLEKVASKQLRDFIFDNAKVKTAMFYPASSRYRTPKEFLVAYEKFVRNNNGGNKSSATIKKNNTKVIDETSEFDGWCSVKLSDLIADSLKKKRKDFKVVTEAYKAIKADSAEIRKIEDLDKMEPANKKKVEFVLDRDYPGGLEALLEESRELAKHPLDELFKLCGNTVYGVVVSRFFQLSNPLVGNNITSRCRSMIWYFQAACRGWNAITDGGLMRLDQVFYPKETGRRLTEKATLLVEASNRDLHNNKISSRPIGGYDSIAWEGDELVFRKGSQETRFNKDKIRGNEEDGDGYLDLVDRLVLDHVRSSFPEEISVLKPGSPFVFETKGVVRDAAIHGAGNYYLRGGSHDGYAKGSDRMVKMRSYSEAIHKKILIPFFESLLEDPTSVDRSKHSEPFISSQILKTGAYSEQFESYYGDTFLEPGDTLYQARFFRELGISGFRFLNREQEKDWMRFHNFNRMLDLDHHSIGQSFESDYDNEKGFLNYAKMVETINRQILAGKRDLKKKAAPNPHPQTIKVQELRRNLRKMFLKDHSKEVHGNDLALDRETDFSCHRELELLYDELPDELWF